MISDSNRTNELWTKLPRRDRGRASGPSGEAPRGRPGDVSAASGSHPVGTRCPLLLTLPEVRALSSAGITRPQRSYDPVRLPPWPPPFATLRPLPSPLTGLPPLPEPPFRRAVPTTPADRAGACVDCFPTHTAFAKWQEGRHPHVTFEACSGFTHVTARRIAQSAKATFVTRLQPFRFTRPSRSSATRSIDNSLDEFLSAQVIRAFGVHCQRWGNRPAQLVDSLRFWVLRFRLMMKRPQASEGEAQHGPFCWLLRRIADDQGVIFAKRGRPRKR